MMSMSIEVALCLGLDMEERAVREVKGRRRDYFEEVVCSVSCLLEVEEEEQISTHFVHSVR